MLLRDHCSLTETQTASCVGSTVTWIHAANAETCRSSTFLIKHAANSLACSGRAQSSHRRRYMARRRASAATSRDGSPATSTGKEVQRYGRSLPALYWVPVLYSALVAFEATCSISLIRMLPLPHKVKYIKGLFSSSRKGKFFLHLQRFYLYASKQTGVFF
jgi:hypothetical protein